MFSHVTLGCEDVARSATFYDAVLGPLNLVRSDNGGDTTWAMWTGATPGGPSFMVCQPLNEKAPSVGNGSMIAFEADSTDVVDACHAQALIKGGTSEGEPGPRPHYHARYYGGYFRDLDGNKICVCCHTAEPA